MPVNTSQRLNQVQTSLRNQATKTHAEDGKMGKQDFMNLFLTQMSNQNPTDPMDSGAMMSQLAQMGSMEQLENLNSGMKSLNETQGKIAGMQAMGYLDKDILIKADELQMSRGSSQPLYYNLPKDAEQLKVIVETEEGSPILNQKLGYAPTGRHRFQWDGKDERGILQGDGKYQVFFQASYADGTNERLSAYNHGRVSGVEYQDGQAWVQAQGRKVPLNQVRSVDNTSARIFDSAQPLPHRTEIAPKGVITKAPKVKL